MESFDKGKLSIVVFLLAFGLLSSCDEKEDNSALLLELESLKAKYAPDSRTALFSYELQDNVLVGETDNKTAKEALAEYLSISGLVIMDSLRLLPAAQLGADTLAYVNVSVASIRAENREASELSTQVLLGTPLRVLDDLGSWIRVQTPDRYIGYVENSAISFDEWTGSKVIFIDPFGFSYASSSNRASHVSDLTFGDLLVLLRQEKVFSEVQYPDGRIAFVPNNQLATVPDFIKSTTIKALASKSEQLMGVPYLWGGTSFKGVDCSGFTRTAFMMNGIYLPRDASQQALAGDEIDTENSFDNLEEGDLLFFGRIANDKQKVTHVALYLGDKKFIHSSGMVRYGSFDEKSPYYDEYNLNRFFFAKRILGSQNIRHLNAENFY